MSSWILILPILQKLEKLFRPTFLKKSHQRTLDRLHLCTRNFGDPTITVNEASGDLFEFEVSSDVGVYENAGEFTGGDDELGHEVDGIVSVASEFRGRRLVRAEFAI